MHLAPSPLPQHPRILVVDDRSGRRELARLVLGKLGFGVVEAADADAALACLSRGDHFVLVVLSCILGSAKDFVLRLRAAEHAGSSLPVVILGNEDPGTARACLDGGASAHLPNALDFESLLELVRDQMEPRAPAPGWQQNDVIAIEHLEAFTDGDTELEQELASLYLSTAKTYLDQMAEALAAGTSWSKSAHALKGASANLGATRVAALAKAAEHQTMSVEHLKTLRAEVQKVADFFAARPHLTRHQPARLAEGA